MTQDQAEAIGIAALGWLCADDSLLPVFLAASGASAQDLHQQLSAPGGPDTALLIAALDFLLQRDETVMAAAKAQSLPGERLAQAQAVLSGAAHMHWT
ncbi:MAG: DUF3572 family protein [Roseinatronobacter sp.]